MGAADHITKPFHIPELRSKLDRMVRLFEIDHENRVLRETLRRRPGFAGLIGVSSKMQRVYKLIEKVSQHAYPVLILGESGTGKALVARSIHFSGGRRNKPFVPVDCTALVPTLIEAELFGHVKGAFTGAAHTKQGLMESADTGTLFLDEIGELPTDLQAKLLGAIQEKESRPVGGTDRIPVAATNRDLDSMIKEGKFRQDSFFRLNGMQIKLPPLPERKTDIPILINAFLEKNSADAGRPYSFSEDAMTQLLAYDWPGNGRELENAVERATALNNGPILEVADLPSYVAYAANLRAPFPDEILPLETQAVSRATNALLGVPAPQLARRISYDLKRHSDHRSIRVAATLTQLLEGFTESAAGVFDTAHRKRARGAFGRSLAPVRDCKLRCGRDVGLRGSGGRFYADGGGPVGAQAARKRA